MVKRILHSIAMLTATIVAYQAYVLLAVPWLEPPLVVKPRTPTPQSVYAPAEPSITRYQRLLAAYFPKDHWSLVRPPKVVENDTGSVMFVLDDYQRHDDGRVDLTHFALLIFPTSRQESATPPRDAVILEAPQGAQLVFDKSFRPERGQIGEIVRGKFPGKITVRSDMRSEGPDDDLWIETRDLEMNSKLLFTPHEVRFRFGPNFGGGRELEIRLLADENAKSRTTGLKIAGVDALEVRRDVRLRAFLAAENLLPGGDPAGAGRGQQERRLPSGSAPSPPASSPEKGSYIAVADPAQPPVDVTCTGPFHFDFLRYVASFDQNVEAWQTLPDGPANQLSCERLDIHFARRANSDPPSGAAALDPARRQREDAPLLEPAQIVAEGYPVVIVSPSRGALVRGGRVQLMLRQRRIAVEGGQDVMVAYGPNQLRAPTIVYEHPSADAQTQIGSFRADGPGTLHYVADPTKPDQVLQAAWQASVQLGRANGQPVLSLAGRPRLAASGAGQLSADQIRVYLRELAVDPAATPADTPLVLSGQGGTVQVVPDRVHAFGQVEIESPQLWARTRDLTATFFVEPAEADGAAAGGLDLAPRGGDAPRTYQVAADSMQLEIALRGQRAAPKSLACNGQVAFRELPSPANKQQPIEIRGAQLAATDLDTSARVTIRGAPPGESPGTRKAEILARGMTFQAAEVQLDQAQNRLWSDGPGTATMTVHGDLFSVASRRESPGGPPTPIHIRWQGGVTFDGRHVVFQRNIEIEGPDDWVQCDELVGKLSAPVEFGKTVDQNEIELAEVEFRGHVKMDHKSRDADGLTSHERAELPRLAINVITGALNGDGPGVIRSAHLSEQLSALGGAPASRAVPGPEDRGRGRPGSPGNSRLQFLRVDFQEGLVGNMHSREIEFLRRVRAVYGPIDAWEQELTLDRPELLPPEAITLTSNSLQINESALAPRQRPADGRSVGPVQMIARGNVRINGQSPGHGAYTATADRISYDQSKELLILEGTDRTPATLYHQKQLGGEFLKNAAHKIFYNRATGTFSQEGVHLFEFAPGSATPLNAIGPTPRRQ